ncbi:hypothetical protein ACWDA8_08845, partial [Streptomyces sp. NPDC001130]
MYYEIRRYQAQPGRREEWVRYMEDVVLPFQTSLGMDVTASFIDDEERQAESTGSINSQRSSD